ncbi:MAG: ergothioneine biosynthesis protein EgtB [Deltaproteobacteria bacterium]|nr:ergothioneine biosynthesis protein EgtB [Deltaproteobacteria bacterium]
MLRYKTVRQRSVSVCAPLSIEDHAIQSMPDASPAKWHLAHTTWFFEQLVLSTIGSPSIDPRYRLLFNSDAESFGPLVDRAMRGRISRPSLEEVHAYRAAVDGRIEEALAADRLDGPAQAVIELGLHHEQQHQELLLTDVKHVLGTQPLQPAYRTDLERTGGGTIGPLEWIELDGGLVEMGAGEHGFSFANERPRHQAVIAPFSLATRPLCNAEVLAFMGDGGYDEPRLWLEDGFATAQREGWRAPLYWEHRDGMWMQYDLAGVREVDAAETACHLSYYEADAIARWTQARLPTEAEWELAATGLRPRAAHWADDDRLHPRPATGDGIRQLFGDVWEWTQSAYAPYPGARSLAGSIGEYNGKFSSGNMVLRGGSCLTPRGHVRASYRNFFAPSARWQMTGVRLATDRGAP